MVFINDIVKSLEELEDINTETSFNYAQICSRYLRDSKTEDEGLKIIINVLNNWNKIDASTHEMWTDLVEAAGFYPYLEKEKDKIIFKNTSGEIRKEFHKSKYLNKYFHEEQKLLNEILNGKENFALWTIRKNL